MMHMVSECIVEWYYAETVSLQIGNVVEWLRGGM